MPVLRCEQCGRGFVLATGRPAKRCPDCRGRAGQRYGSAHKRLRAAGVEAAYGTPCARCGRPLEYGQELHLDHADGGGPGDYRGWSHAACNIAAGNRHRHGRAVKAAQLAVSQPVATRPGPPYDPGPRRQDVEHKSWCQCERMAVSLGAWPSRCW